MRDLGSRDFEFIKTVSEIRTELLALAGVTKEDGYESVIIQGSGTFGIESVLSSVVGNNDHLLILINGAYGERMLKIATVHDLKVSVIRYSENRVPDHRDVENILQKEISITHVAMVHCETTTGIFNPLNEIGAICSRYGKVLIVDAMSSFGAVPLKVNDIPIHFLISSSNKCIQGIPGFSFVIARREALIRSKDKARTLTLDLFAQWQGLEADGQFRFTPPVQALLAFRKALEELQEEGGVDSRANRYKENCAALIAGMEQLGFETYLDSEYRGYIITTFHYPNSPKFDFAEFYKALNEKGYVIYPGKLTKADCFRIGNIGTLGLEEIKGLLNAIAGIQKELY